MQLIQRAHVGGLDLLQGVRAGILRKEVVEKSVIFEIFGDGDAQNTRRRLALAEMQLCQQQHHGGNDDKEQHRDADIAHAGRKADRHREKDHADLACRAGCGTETHKPESTGDGDACADVAVDKHDDDLHNGGQDRQRDGKALGALRLIHAAKRRGDAEGEGNGGTNEKRGQGEGIGDDGIKH